MYYNAPSAVGIAEFPAEEEDHVWSIRVFNAFDGFKDHFPVPVGPRRSGARGRGD